MVVPALTAEAYAMTPEQYERAGDLFHRLRALPKLDRDSALDLACEGNAELRSEVVALIEGDEEAESDSFLRHPAFENAAALLIGPEADQARVPELIAGRYRVGPRIGAGGMGVVYEAEDLRLSRRVALKILPGSMGRDQELYRRFQREARAASQLNDPHIVAIHDSGMDAGLSFIAMELVEGRTLRQLMTGNPLPDAKTVLDVVSQTASALSAAHRAGIVHRDIKPENVMVRPDGLVKVLDFGLARIRDPITGDRHPTLLTRPGQLAGTVQYLPPERVLGQAAGPQADVFSLGVVAYEFATGVRPFDGVTDGAVFDAILHRDPRLPSEVRPELGVELDAVIMGALEKDPDLRLQTADELKRACQRSGKVAKPGEAAGAQGRKRTIAHGRGSARRRKRLPQGRTFVWSASVMAAMAAGVGLWLTRPASGPAVVRSIQITNGEPVHAFVNDGTRIYYSAGQGDANTPMFQVSSEGGEPFPMPQFKGMLPLDISGDHSEILLGELRDGKNGPRPLWVGSALGGAARRLGDLQARFARWSSRGDLIVYATQHDLGVAHADGSPSRIIFRAKDGGVDSPFFLDGDRQIRFTLSEHNSNKLWQLNVDGSDPHLVLPNWDGGLQGEATISADRRYSAYIAGRNNHNWDLWAFPENSGFFGLRKPRPVRLTTGPLVAKRPQFSPDGRRIFFIGDAGLDELVRFDPESRKWMPYMGGINAIQLDFSRNGEWVTYVGPPGHSVWRSRVDGSERAQLTTPPLNAVNPRWSPDGTKIVFYGGVPGEPSGMFLVPASGGTVTALTAKGSGARFEAEPSWSPGGNRVLYSVDNHLEVIDIRTREVERLPGSDGIWAPRWSPDGKYAAAPDRKSHLYLYDMTAHKQALLTTVGAGYPSWSRDSKYVYFENDPCSVWYRIDIRDRNIVRMANMAGLRMAADALGWVGVNPDGSVVSARDASTRNIYAIDLELP